MEIEPEKISVRFVLHVSVPEKEIMDSLRGRFPPPAPTRCLIISTNPSKSLCASLTTGIRVTKRCFNAIFEEKKREELRNVGGVFVFLRSSNFVLRLERHAWSMVT